MSEIQQENIVKICTDNVNTVWVYSVHGLELLWDDDKRDDDKQTVLSMDTAIGELRLVMTPEQLSELKSFVRFIPD